ncbi:DUF2975 domain-containing protein [Sphingomonas japonica]|uniref:DUF2975 domain-containing protein n=1 Tax=Sphingomonas japonica TaxID=511662 RepID=A0ABX0U328_9SPHN|nr:DUF2975 domain-containing protein [Sphingomonas japonica]NIJ24898.1 hypothetical protein [Sphingomonas japonica]
MSISKHARIAQILTGLVLAAVTLGIALNSTGLVIGPSDTTVRYAQIVATLPALFYLVAIWTVHRALGALAKGDAVEKTLSELLARVGTCLFLGGLVRVFVEPFLMRWVSAGPWPVGNFDIGAVTLGTVGLLLVLVAGPLRDAAAMRTELGQIL